MKNSDLIRSPDLKSFKKEVALCRLFFLWSAPLNALHDATFQVQYADSSSFREGLNGADAFY
ncbi:hypothetical protein AD952_04660 [Acetobacter cerevisiae]|uniref:Uncharacterized protein n=1 Tax=Acetobacter cerevisiae TaxID=178900 RepID=A0A149VDK0_9PROT|nr:hypothetical protein AD952_04660 [Acetobacter cerevisiae]KXV78321.1 hypothetical protein AD954_03405 [Acetobacter cerevisiae]